jgi:hypothetical protein
MKLSVVPGYHKEYQNGKVPEYMANSNIYRVMRHITGFLPAENFCQRSNIEGIHGFRFIGDRKDICITRLRNSPQLDFPTEVKAILKTFGFVNASIARACMHVGCWFASLSGKAMHIPW